jgi:riboflavin biosynthesis pyrimidine reductase
MVDHRPALIVRCASVADVVTAVRTAPDVLLANGLLDELRLWVPPFMLGKGAASVLLFRAERAGQFDLVQATPLASGNVVLTYRVA